MTTGPDNWRTVSGVSDLDKPFTLDLIVMDDLIDVSIDQRRTLIVRSPDRVNGDRLFFFADGGEVRFEDIQVRPLSEK
jgi:hypothetical protein